MMKILLFGKNGQLGWELQRSLQPLGQVIALDRNSAPLCGDLCNLEGIAASIESVRPALVVNAAAYTAVDKAQNEQAMAHCINAQAPKVMAQAAQNVGAWLMHYSTDYVFDGAGHAPWLENDATAPLNVYGQTKLDGEQAIMAHCTRYLILRTSWVFAARGSNFAKTMVRLAQERNTLTVIDDQHGAPTGADLLADASSHAIAKAMRETTLSGVYHLVAGGNTTWYGYAQYVLKLAKQAGVDLKIDEHAVQAIPSSRFQAAAKRPLNSRLSTQKFQTTFNLNLPSWQVGVERMMHEWLSKN